MIEDASIDDFLPESGPNLPPLQARLDEISSRIKELLRNPSSISVQQLQTLDALTADSQATLTHVQRDFKEQQSLLIRKFVELKWKDLSFAHMHTRNKRPPIAHRPGNPCGKPQCSARIDGSGRTNGECVLCVFFDPVKLLFLLSL